MRIAEREAQQTLRNGKVKEIEKLKSRKEKRISVRVRAADRTKPGEELAYGKKPR